MRALISDYAGVLDGPDPEASVLVGLLGDARGNGCRTAILSNDQGGPQASALRSLAGSVVDVVVLSGDVGVAKPDPRIYRIVAERLGVEPQACIFIDREPGDETPAEDSADRTGGDAAT